MTVEREYDTEDVVTERDVFFYAILVTPNTHEITYNNLVVAFPYKPSPATIAASLRYVQEMKFTVEHSEVLEDQATKMLEGEEVRFDEYGPWYRLVKVPWGRAKRLDERFEGL